MTDQDTIRLFTLNELCLHRMVEPHDVPWLVHVFGRSEIVKRLGREYVDRMLLLCALDGISARNRDMLHAGSHRILRDALVQHAPSKRAREWRSPWPDVNESDPHGLYENDYTGVAQWNPGRTIGIDDAISDSESVIMELRGDTFVVVGRAYPRRVLSDRGRFVLRLRDTVARTRTRPLNGTKVYP